MERETHIMVVDDEPYVTKLVERTLEDAGYVVTVANDGNSALAMLAEKEPDLVLLDIRMPGMSGIEVLRQLNANWPEICVVMATAVADAETAIETMKLGAYDYIIKPFDRDEVVLKLKRALEKKHLELENERRQLELQKRVGEQTARLQEQFVNLVETLAREHKLIYRLASKEKGSKEALSNLPKELQEPMASVEEFSEALLKLLSGGLSAWPRARRIDKSDSLH